MTDLAAELQIDEVLDTPVTDRPKRIRGALDSIRKYATFAQLLRMGGAIGVVAAMSLFLLQGIEVANDLQRYLTLLAQTMVLTASGFLVSFLLKDNKGARVFFGLGLISVPVNFAVLGAMLYSIVSLDVQNVVYPAMVGWHVAGFGELGIAALAAAAVLIPVTFFGLAVMSRPNAKLFGGLFLLSSATLLIPVREIAVAAIIACAVVFYVITVLKRHSKDTAQFKTLESRFAQGLIFVAPVLMVSRSLALYSASIYTALILSIMVYFVLRYIATRMDADSRLSKIAYFLAIPALFILSALTADISTGLFGQHWQLPVFAVIFARQMVELSQTSKNAKTGSVLMLLGGFCLLVASNVFAVMNPGLFNMPAAGIITLVVTLYALFQKHTRLVLIASVFLAPHAFSQLIDLWTVVDFGNWITLAVLGVVAIVGASLLERYGAVWKVSWESRRADLLASKEAGKSPKLDEGMLTNLEDTAMAASSN